MPSLRSWPPSTRMAFLRALTVHTAARREPGRDGCGVRVHTIPESLPTSIAATRSWTRSCSSSSITCGPLTAASYAGSDGTGAGCPGVPDGGHQARNTDRRAQGNIARPSGQDPSARLIYGFVFHSAPTSRAARPTVPPPAHPHQPQPARDSSPSPPRPAPARIFTPRDHPQMRWPMRVTGSAVRQTRDLVAAGDSAAAAGLYQQVAAQLGRLELRLQGAALGILGRSSLLIMQDRMAEITGELEGDLRMPAVFPELYALGLAAAGRRRGACGGHPPPPDPLRPPLAVPDRHSRPAHHRSRRSRARRIRLPGAVALSPPGPPEPTQC